MAERVVVEGLQSVSWGSWKWIHFLATVPAHSRWCAFVQGCSICRMVSQQRYEAVQQS